MNVLIVDENEESVLILAKLLDTHRSLLKNAPLITLDSFARLEGKSKKHKALQKFENPHSFLEMPVKQSELITLLSELIRKSPLEDANNHDTSLRFVSIISVIAKAGLFRKPLSVNPLLNTILALLNVDPAPVPV